MTLKELASKVASGSFKTPEEFLSYLSTEKLEVSKDGAPLTDAAPMDAAPVDKPAGKPSDKPADSPFGAPAKDEDEESNPFASLAKSRSAGVKEALKNDDNAEDETVDAGSY